MNENFKVITADELADNTEQCIVLVNITRDVIENCNVASTLEKLYVLTDSRENFTLYRDSVLLSISGYDEDPRELVEIPEVRAFFGRLVSEWGHWLWFMARGNGMMALLFAFLCEVDICRGPHGMMTGTDFKDAKEVVALFNVLASRSKPMFVAHAIPPDEVLKSIRSAAAELNL